MGHPPSSEEESVFVVKPTCPCCRVEHKIHMLVSDMTVAQRELWVHIVGPLSRTASLGVTSCLCRCWSS